MGPPVELSALAGAALVAIGFCAAPESAAMVGMRRLGIAAAQVLGLGRDQLFRGRGRRLLLPGLALDLLHHGRDRLGQLGTHRVDTGHIANLGDRIGSMPGLAQAVGASAQSCRLASAALAFLFPTNGRLSSLEHPDRASAARRASPTDITSHWPLLPAWETSQGPNLEPGLEQRTGGVAQRLGRAGVGGGDRQIVRHDDPLQAGHIR